MRKGVKLVLYVSFSNDTDIYNVWFQYLFQ